jgi:GNAT superfamily N-acetyltransferase
VHRAEDDHGHDEPYPHVRRAPASVDPFSARALRPCLAFAGRTLRWTSSVPTAPRRHRVLAGALAVRALLAARVVPACFGDTPQLAGVIARAVSETDLGRWLVPHDAARQQILRDYAQCQCELALQYGGWIDTTADLAGVAVWSPVDTADCAVALAAAVGPYADRFRLWHQLCGAYRPAGHTQLTLLAVQPGRRGEGIGGSLLDAHRAKLDERRSAVYLVAHSAQVCALYLRHGYRLLPGASFSLPSDGPLVYPMARPACPQQPG